MRDLRGRTVLITGAGSGLGRMMSIELAAEGEIQADLSIRSHQNCMI